MGKVEAVIDVVASAVVGETVGWCSVVGLIEWASRVERYLLLLFRSLAEDPVGVQEHDVL